MDFKDAFSLINEGKDEKYVLSFGSHFEMFIRFCFRQMLSEIFMLAIQLKIKSDQGILDGSVVIVVPQHFGTIL